MTAVAVPRILRVFLTGLAFPACLDFDDLGINVECLPILQPPGDEARTLTKKFTVMYDERLR